MLNFKHSFRNMFKDTKCRLSGMENGSQEHALEVCTKKETLVNGTVTIREIFEEDQRKKQSITTEIIRKIMDKFQVQPSKRMSDPADPRVRSN